MSEAAIATDLVEVPAFGPNPGALAMYEHVPAGLPEGAPVVVVLHGCTQRAADIAKAGWNTLADERGFVAVYPEQRDQALKCFGWSPGVGSANDLVRGKGENGSIKAMVDRALSAHGGDARRVFVVGFSAGGAEAAVMAALWPEVFAGAASFAGVPFGCSSSFFDVNACMNPGQDRTAKDWGDRVRGAVPGYAGPYPRFAVWQGTSDAVVGPKNRTQLARQWTHVHGLAMSDAETETVDGHLHETWRDGSGRVVVESYAIEGLRHGMPVVAGCGEVGSYAFDRGVCGARKVADFFGL